ncbi:hypothetical protein BBJ28_00005590 [Nothophytophthora sp. Chile5]|nr:hypothetical protein BBJ28_00005590 [Nothophytophthora sp. Chile5]
MNGYLRSKCRSEQQLLNELAKLLGARDVASRKMGDVLRELTFFYASAPAARATHLPHTLLSGLCALLPQLKDKKESVLLKEDHLRITRLALCLVARLIDQFELHVQNASSLSDGSEAGVEKPSVGLATSALAGFLTVLETAVLTPSGLLLPRQRAIVRVYAQLCRVFHKRDQLVSHTAGLLQQSPVLADPPTVDVKGKRSSTAPGPAQVAAVAAACHALRFHVESDEQIVALDKLVQAAFVIPAGTASRHASSTLLALFTSSSPADEDRPPHAVAVAKALERFLLKARPSSLRSGDSLTSVYLLRLCGLLHRLPVHQQQPVPLANEGADSDLDSKLLTANDPLEAQVQSAAIQGVVVSNALAAMLQEYLMDVIQATVADGASSKPVVAPAVLLTAVEEALRGSDTQTSFLKLPNWGNMCLFELVAAALLSLLPSQRDAAKAAGHAVVLHRVCRAVQFVAERLDTAVLQLNTSSGQSTPSPAYLSHLALRVRSLTKHSNAFVACEALRAFVWLLPRGDAGSQDAEDDWPALMTQLETLPLDHIQPERRAAIAWTLFRRGVTTPKTHRYAVDTTLLAGCLRVVLAWFRARPCVWHAALLTAVWHTALRDCLAPLGNAVFASINEVLDYQCAPSDPAAADSLVVKQSALQFLSQREGGVRYAVQRQVWSRPLLLRLTKQALLETCTSQRLSVRALSQLHQEAERQGSSPLTEQLAATLRFLQRTPGQPGQTDSASSGAFESRALTTPASDFSNWGESNSVEMPQQVVAADEDPFSDFRAPADATVSLVTEETVAKKYGDIATAEDPFVDFREAERTASAGFTGWGDFDTANKQTEVAETKDEAFSVFDAPGDNTPSSAFAAWDDDDSTHKPDEAAGDPFTDFRATDSTAAAGFTDWPDEGLAEKQQTAADTAGRPSPDIGAAGAASAFPSWGGDVAVETQEDPGDSGEAFMEVKASGDSEAPKRADVDDIAANFDEKDAAFSAFSAPSADSAFAGWGDSVAVEEQDDPSEAVSFVDCAVVDDSTASTFANSPDGDTKEMQQLPSPATGEAFADFRASEETAASGFTNWGCSATVEETQEEGPAVLDNRDQPESAFASWADGDTTEMQPAVSDGHDHSELVFDAGTIESPPEAALSNWMNGDAAAKSEAADQGQGLTASEQHAAFDVHDEIHAEFHDTISPNPSSWTESDATKATFGTQGSTPDVGVAVSESVIPLDSDAAEELDTDLEPVCADTEASTTAAASPFASWGEEDASEAFSGTVACGAEVSFTFPSNDLVTEQHAAATTSTLDERFEACGVGMEETSVLDGEMTQKHDGLDGLSAPQIDPSAGFEDCDVVLDAATPSSSNDAVAFEETTIRNAFASFKNTSDGALDAEDATVSETEIRGGSPTCS